MILVPGRGCDSLECFTKKAAVLVSVSAQVIRDLFFHSTTSQKHTIILLRAIHVTYSSYNQLRLSTELHPCVFVSVLRFQLIRQCLELAAHLCHASYFMTFLMFAQYWIHHCHHYACTFVQPVTPQQRDFLWLTQQVTTAFQDHWKCECMRQWYSVQDQHQNHRLSRYHHTIFF